MNPALAAARYPDAGWDPRLWRLWVFYTALGYTVILATVSLLTSVGLDATHLAVDHRTVGTMLIATIGALLYGFVLGTLQWRVLRERVAIPRRRWVRASVIPALIVWVSVIVPAAFDADRSGDDLRVAYILALSQALALGPLIGFAQARALQPYTPRWKWWIAGNLGSWLIVYAAFYLVSLVLGAFDFAHGEGSSLEAYIVLIASTPLSGRWLLWVTAPGVVSEKPIEPARRSPGGNA